MTQVVKGPGETHLVHQYTYDVPCDRPEPRPCAGVYDPDREAPAVWCDRPDGHKGPHAGGFISWFAA